MSAAAGRRRVGPRVGGRTRLALLVLLATAACARPEAPPGGEPDRTAPQVVGTSPESMSIVQPWDGEVVVRFDERLSERGMEDVLQVSPATGRPQLDRASWGAELRVSVEGGWRPDRIYRVVLRPGLQDRFGNAREEPIEVVFSTGPEIPTGAITGAVTDRMTGRPVRDARVEARPPGDTLPLLARSDTAGRFVIAHLRPGGYRVRAFSDDNRSAAPEPFEPIDEADAELAADGDTARLALALLQPDSTPARLARAEAIDSVHVRVVFDDAFDPARPLDATSVRLWRMPDSTRVRVGELVHAHTYEQRRQAAEAAARAAEADTLAAGAGVADTTAPGEAPDTAAPRPPSVGAVPAMDSIPQDSAAAEPLPARELVLVVAERLEAASEHLVEITDVTNIAGVPGGGGTVAFETPEPPPDTTSMPPDSAAVPPDTTGAAPPDTTAAPPPDTTAAEARDSTRGPPRETTPAAPPDPSRAAGPATTRAGADR